MALCTHWSTQCISVVLSRTAYRQYSFLLLMLSRTVHYPHNKAFVLSGPGTCPWQPWFTLHTRIPKSSTTTSVFSICAYWSLDFNIKVHSVFLSLGVLLPWVGTKQELCCSYYRPSSGLGAHEEGSEGVLNSVIQFHQNRAFCDVTAYTAWYQVQHAAVG